MEERIKKRGRNKRQRKERRKEGRKLKEIRE
jgi:hypothetical protein